MKQFKRVFLIVADSAGIGEEPDAAKFDDVGTNTWVHAAQAVGGIHVPVMEETGDVGFVRIGEFVSLSDGIG